MLVEANRICGGITQDTTAKVTVAHGLIYDKMISRFGRDTAKAYLAAQREAAQKYRQLCRNIECDYEERASYVYSLKNKKIIEREVAALRSIGCRAELTDSLPLPFEVQAAVRVDAQAQLHPLKLLYSLAEELPIFEDTKVLELTGDGVMTNRGRIFAEKIVVATHFPFINKHGSYFLKMYQHRSYVIALKNAPDLRGMYVDEDEKGMSFRNYNGLLLLGGGSHRTGKKGGGWTELSEFARRYYPSAKEVCRFATQDCMTLDDIPYIGQYSSRTPGLYVATGYNKWGMTSAMAAATVICDLVQGRENRYASLFSPSRSMLRPQLAINAAESLAGLLRPTAPRCPHLGCALKYNAAEHSWDCSCHGSRFGETGELIDNPATDDKKGL